MPIYPPRNHATKKAEILNQKIHELLKYSDTNSEGLGLVNKAEKVKVAKLNFLKAKLNLTKSYKAEDEGDSVLKLREKFKKEIAEWEIIEIEEIQNYCEKVGRI